MLSADCAMRSRLDLAVSSLIFLLRAVPMGIEGFLSGCDLHSLVSHLADLRQGKGDCGGSIFIISDKALNKKAAWQK